VLKLNHKGGEHMTYLDVDYKTRACEQIQNKFKLLDKGTNTVYDKIDIHAEIQNMILELVHDIALHENEIKTTEKLFKEMIK